MRRTLSLASLVTPLLLGGCTVSRTTIEPLPPLETRRLDRASPGESAVVGAFRSDGTAVTGHVDASRACRIVMHRTERHERVRTREPHRGAGTLAGVLAGVTGATSIVLLSQLNEFSDSTSCFRRDCGSPRGSATAGALVLLGTSIALAAASGSTFAARPVRVTEELDSISLPPRTLAAGVPCGNGPVAGLGVSLWRFDERVAATTTDAQGDATLAVPAGISGALRVVADSVPPEHPLVMPGETLGWVHVAPESVIQR